MRAVVLVALVACAHPKPWRPVPAAREVAIADDLVVRVEVDGTTSVMTRAELEGAPPAFGVVRLPAEDRDGARSPRVAIARARAWQVLAQQFAADPDRAREAAARAGACAGCGEMVIDKDLVVRREEDGVVSVTATVALDGHYAAGYARLRKQPFEKAAAAGYLDDVARGRGWQVLGRAAEPERAYAAYQQGVAVTSACGASDAIFGRHRAEVQHADGKIAEAVATLRELLDENLEACAIHLHAQLL